MDLSLRSTRKRKPVSTDWKYQEAANALIKKRKNSGAGTVGIKRRGRPRKAEQTGQSESEKKHGVDETSTEETDDDDAGSDDDNSLQDEDKVDIPKGTSKNEKKMDVVIFVEKRKPSGNKDAHSEDTQSLKTIASDDVRTEPAGNTPTEIEIMEFGSIQKPSTGVGGDSILGRVQMELVNIAKIEENNGQALQAYEQQQPLAANNFDTSQGTAATVSQNNNNSSSDNNNEQQTTDHEGQHTTTDEVPHNATTTATSGSHMNTALEHNGNNSEQTTNTVSDDDEDPLLSPQRRAQI